MAIQSSIDRLNSIKERIRTNLAAQGITVPADAVLADMAEQILSVAGEDGRGIVSIVRTSGNGSAGSTDVYTITYTDATTSTFPVYNGADGKTYVLTAADKAEIAEMAADMVDVPEIDTSNVVMKSGATMTGALVAQNNTNYTTKQVRNAVISTSESGLSGLSNGDFVFIREV